MSSLPEQENTPDSAAMDIKKSLVIKAVPKCGKTVEGRREKKPLPGMIFLLAFGTRRNLTLQVISPVYRLLADHFLNISPE